MNKYKITKRFLHKEYITNRKSMRRIATQLNCSFPNICNYLKKYNIKIRTKSEAQKGIYNARYIDGRTLKIYYCKESKCNNIINYDTWKDGQGRCKSCGFEIVSQKVKGKNNGRYLDGRSYELYPIEFNDKLKLEIRTRDNYTCQNCGLTEEEHLIVYGRVLEVHHIDYNKQNCKEDNLITTCKQCNLRANSNRNYWEVYFQAKIKDKIW